ncbi:group III truncated hemoglobin [Parapedobacter tibetensis]|uniref:group III truncated hemoglobin n=1 Tax=Parapedobacter tibetensis TaxID=2972951 RepID=UPI00214DE674|nr:group III truncated hemoglobin [Parapedobacter tibetensis]
MSNKYYNAIFTPRTGNMVAERQDIQTLEDIKLMVDSFYAKMKDDPLIGPIFTDKIQDHWPEHLDKMYRFWQGLLLGEHTYHGRPFPPHTQLPIGIEHFERWLVLFRGTVDELYVGPIADEAKLRANSIANVFYNKLKYTKES